MAPRESAARIGLSPRPAPAERQRMTGAVTKFSKKVIDAIAATLPSNSDPARLALLPRILRAWTKEDLHEHLSRGGRAATREREKRLRSVGSQAQKLIDAIETLDHTGFFETALKPQMRDAGTNLWDTDITAAKQRRDSAISWLIDLVEIFDGSENEADSGGPEPDKKTCYFFVILDLAAIFELVSGEEATRREDPSSGRTYGPFVDFAASVWVQIFENSRGLSYGIRVWADEMNRQRKAAEAAVKEATRAVSRDLSDLERDAIENRFGHFSSFVANIQFRHPGLWRKLRRTSDK
jgi:hypothetical protein